MELHLHRPADAPGHFGEALDRWLWQRLLPELPCLGHADDLFVATGAPLDGRLPAGRRKLIFGAGAACAGTAPADGSWDVRFVRGPLTARALGLDPHLAITDAAVLVREVVTPRAARRHRRVFMPRWRDAHPGWAGACRAAGMHYLDPRRPVGEVLDEIADAETLFTAVLHGAIIADCLRVPWVALRSVALGSVALRGDARAPDFQWRDWCASLALDYAPEDLPLLWLARDDPSAPGRLRATLKRVRVNTCLQGLIARAAPSLSTDAVLADRFARACEQLERLRAGAGAADRAAMADPPTECHSA